MQETMWRGTRKYRNQLLLLTICIMTLYLLYHRQQRRRELALRKLELEEEELDEDVVEEQLESKKKIEKVTFMPPGDEMHAWAKGKSDTKAMEADIERSRKYHNIWSYAHSATSVHNLWEDTPDADTVLSALQRARIVYVEAIDREDYSAGTSEKWTVYLEGGQKAMMKLVWEPKTKGDMKPKGHCNFGFEMAWSEIAAFHLHRVLGFRNTPYATGRVVDLEKEILPNASPAVARQLSYKGSQICVTGKCFHCKKGVTMCPPGGRVQASMVYWISHKLRLWTLPPKYMPYSTPRRDEYQKYGFNDPTYCKKIRHEPPYDTLRYYHDLFDYAVIDTLMHHYDAKHYIVDDKLSKASGLSVRLDHGRAFCAYTFDKLDIFLAPLNQCCTMRRETYWKLKSFQQGTLTDKLKTAFANDPINPILNDSWYEAIERRLTIIVDLADKCLEAVGGTDKFLVG